MHIHLMWKTSNDYKKYLLFRDYLRENKKETDRYYSLKKTWFKRARDDRHKYVKMKTDSGYVNKIVEKAKKHFFKTK